MLPLIFQFFGRLNKEDATLHELSCFDYFEYNDEYVLSINLLSLFPFRKGTRLSFANFCRNDFQKKEFQVNRVVWSNSWQCVLNNYQLKFEENESRYGVKFFSTSWNLRSIYESYWCHINIRTNLTESKGVFPLNHVRKRKVWTCTYSNNSKVQINYIFRNKKWVNCTLILELSQ